MEVVAQLMNGFAAVFTLENLFACFMGVFIGTIVGVLPGIGPVSSMALLLPFSFGLDVGTSLVLLGGIYYGSMYGGSTTSILINMPGEGASVVTCIDGYQMAKKGRAGAALAVSAIGSWVAGTLGVVLLMVFAPPLGQLALSFGPPEYLGISLIGMILLSNLTGDSFLKSMLMFIVGMMIATIGIDSLLGFNRLSFGVMELSRGIDMLPLAMGLFGMGEVLSVALEPYGTGELIKVKFRDLYPTKQEVKKSILPIVRGSLIGFPIGLIPGPAPLISSLVSYKVEKSASKHPEEFGHGAIEGVAGPESANNAAAAGAMVPLFGPGHTLRSGHCGSSGRLYDPRDNAGSVSYFHASGIVLACYREHVYRQYHAPDTEPAPGGRVRIPDEAAAEDIDADCGRHHVCRGLHRKQQLFRYHTAHHIRNIRIYFEACKAFAGSAGHRVCA